MDNAASSFVSQDELNMQYQRSQGELYNVVDDDLGPGFAAGSTRPPKRQRAHTADSRTSYNNVHRPTIRNLRIANTPRFYDSAEHEDEAKLKPTTTQKMRQSKHLPHWIWSIIIIILGIGRQHKWISWIIYGLTIISALAFTCLGVIFVVYDISSSNSKTTAHIGFISLLIGFAWLSLGIYSFGLAGRLFGDEDFSTSVRRHSRTLFKISSAALLILSGILFQGLNLYCAFVTYTDDHCHMIGLHHLVCHSMYICRAVFSILATMWNLMVGCILLSVCRTHTIGIRRFLRDLEEDGKKYENYWKEKLQNSKDGEYNRETSSILNDKDWFVLHENDPIMDEIIQGSQLEQPGGATNGGFGQGSSVEQPDDVVLMRATDDVVDRPSTPRLNMINQISEESTGTATDLHDEPPVMTEDEILLCFWKISSRMRFTSRCLQRWLASWIAFVVIWCADYVIYWLSHSPDILEILEFVAPMILLLILCSAYAEANGEGQMMIRCICPTKERYGLLNFLNIQPLQMQVFNLSISYNAILTVILAFSVAFSSRLILDEVMK